MQVEEFFAPEVEAELEAARWSTMPVRRAYVEARRHRESERDRRRLELAVELGGSGAVVIPPDDGFLVAEPGFPGAEAVVAAGNAVLDAADRDALHAAAEKKRTSAKSKAGFLAKNLIDRKTLPIDSPFTRFATSEAVIAPIAAYLGVVPVLNDVDIWYSMYGGTVARSSQLWHIDHDDITQIKVWVHLDDVGPRSGPLTAISAARSDAIAATLDYDMATGYRVPDETIRELIGPGEIAALTGPKGSVTFVDTCACFHFGSRVEEGAPPRALALFDYLTPYSFDYVDHRRQARYRRLADDTSDELARLVLGAV